MRRIVIVAPAALPIPATCGGAIETLIQHLIKQNEVYGEIDLTIISPYEHEAYIKSKEYRKTNFIWYKKNEFKEKIINRVNRHFICPLHKDVFYSSWQGFVIKTLQRLLIDKVVIENNLDFLPILKKYIGNKEIVCHLHNKFEFRQDSFDSCNTVFTVSNYIKQEVIKHTHYPKEKISVIRNCIDRADFMPSPVRRSQARINMQLTDDNIAICYVGRIVELKGIYQLVEAFKRLDSPNTILFIVGALGGNFAKDKQRITPFVRNLMEIVEPVKEKVIFTGYIPNEEVCNILDAMDIAVTPSLYYEAASVSNVEYQAMGLPVITTNRGGIPEFVSSNSGFILDADGNLVEQLYKSLLTLINEPSLREVMGKEGLLNAQNFFSDEYYKRFVELINY